MLFAHMVNSSVSAYWLKIARELQRPKGKTDKHSIATGPNCLVTSHPRSCIEAASPEDRLGYV